MDEVPVSPLSLNSTHHLLDDQSLQDELETLNAAILQANEERAQAAEYGLVLLEEKQALRSQYDELSGLYESTKRELENSVNVCPEISLQYCRHVSIAWLRFHAFVNSKSGSSKDNNLPISNY